VTVRLQRMTTWACPDNDDDMLQNRDQNLGHGSGAHLPNSWAPFTSEHVLHLVFNNCRVLAVMATCLHEMYQADNNCSDKGGDRTHILAFPNLLHSS
jgi:hypothetical protein